MKKLMVATVLGTVLAAAAAQADGDVAAGAETFKRKCSICHVVDPDEKAKPTGPHLHGVIGRKSGTGEGFRYSPAMKEADIVWNEESLAKYLADPRGFIPKNRMAFPGIRKDDELANLVAYLVDATQ